MELVISCLVRAPLFFRRIGFFLAAGFFFVAAGFFFAGRFFLRVGLFLMATFFLAEDFFFAGRFFLRVGLLRLAIFFLRAGFFLTMKKVYQTHIARATGPAAGVESFVLFFWWDLDEGQDGFSFGVHSNAVTGMLQAVINRAVQDVPKSGNQGKSENQETDVTFPLFSPWGARLLPEMLAA